MGVGYDNDFNSMLHVQGLRNEIASMGNTKMCTLCSAETALWSKSKSGILFCCFFIGEVR